MGTSDVLERAAEFTWKNARLLDRRRFAYHFEGGPAAAIVTALRAYQNDDGGFGHALEADLRAPTSTPIFVEIALHALAESGAHEPELLARVVAFLSSVSSPEGTVACAVPAALEYPRAAHWTPDFALTPGLNPTASIAGLLHRLEVEDEWLERATAWCLARIEQGNVGSAHTIRCVFTLLESLPDRKRADALLEPMAKELAAADFFTLDVPVTQYTLTPLHFATAPGSYGGPLFGGSVIEAHLDDLVQRQQPDGGWPIHWEPPGPGAVHEWRGAWTLEALLVLRAYGRI